MEQRQVSSLRRAGDMIEDKEEGKEEVETSRKLSLSGRMTLGQRNKKVVLLLVPEPRTQLELRRCKPHAETHCSASKHPPPTTLLDS